MSDTNKARMNIFVGNLSNMVTEAELRQVFIPFGEVASVTIMNDSHIGSGRARIYGYVEMPSQVEGQTAVKALNGQQLSFQTIEVIQALPLSDSFSNTLCSSGRGSRYSRTSRQRKS